MITKGDPKEQKEQKSLSTEVITNKKGALESLAGRLDLDANVLAETLKKTAFSLCKDDAQFISAIVVANTYGLNPILREMTAFPGSSGGVVPVVMIDGWIKLVNRQPNYDGVELIENDIKEKPVNRSGTTLDSVTAKFYIKGREHPVVITEYMDECYDPSKTTWKRWPRRMLRHKAYIQGARIAFGFSGIYDEDEKDRIMDAEGTVVTTMIGLKHDVNAPAGEPIDIKTSETVSVEFPIIGDLARFGAENIEKAKSMMQNISVCAKKLGQEKYLQVLGGCGYESLEQMIKIPDLVKLTNALLEALK